MRKLFERCEWISYRLRHSVTKTYTDASNGPRIKVRHRGTSDDILAIWQFFKRQQYEIPKPLMSEPYHQQACERFYRATVSSKSIPLIVDCGANIGASAAWFCQKYPEAFLVAIEPADDNLLLLRKNLRPSRTKRFHAAVSSQGGKRYISIVKSVRGSGYRMSPTIST